MLYDREFRRYFSNVMLFTFKDAERFLKRMGASKAYAKLFIHNQIKRHGLLRVGKGRYTFSKNEAIAGFAFSPFYYGLEYALTIHRIWTQMANPVVITATKAVPGVRTSMGGRIIVRRISERMFFGMEMVKYSDIFVPVSNPEKTLLDFIYYKIGLSDIDAASLLRACDRKKLINYSKRYGRMVRIALNKFLERLRPVALADKIFIAQKKHKVDSTSVIRKMRDARYGPSGGF